MTEGRRPEHPEKTPGDENQKMPHTTARRFKPQARLEPAQQHRLQAKKADVRTVTPRVAANGVVYCNVGCVAQRAMERKMLDLKLEDKIPCSEIRKRTKIIDIIEYTLKQKWKWAGHIARLKDNRWTKRCTEWQPRRGKRSRGRPSRRWQDDITEKEGTTWIRKATDDDGRH